MACNCVPADCVPRPSLKDLCCETRGCCESKKLSSVSDEIIDLFESGDAVPDEHAEEYASCLKVMQAYADAIELSVELIADRVCLARYIGQCCIEVCGCVESTCCDCACMSCATCKTAALYLAGEVCVDRDRIAAVPEGFELDDRMRLYGHVSGEFCVRLELKPASRMLMRAIEELACEKVKCLDRKCGRGKNVTSATNDGQTETYQPYTDVRDAGLFGVDAADDLRRECVAVGVKFGCPSPVRSARFVPCEEA